MKKNKPILYDPQIINRVKQVSRHIWWQLSACWFAPTIRSAYSKYIVPGSNKNAWQTAPAFGVCWRQAFQDKKIQVKFGLLSISCISCMFYKYIHNINSISSFLHDTQTLVQYLEENVDKTYLDVGVMTKHLQDRYPEYARRKIAPFRALVEQGKCVCGRCGIFCCCWRLINLMVFILQHIMPFHRVMDQMIKLPVEMILMLPIQKLWMYV